MCRKNLVKKVATAALSLLLVLSQFNVNAFAASASLELLYNFGGCQNDLYTAEAYWVDPIVKDIYKNGKNQIIFGNYSVIVIDAATGKEMWRVNGGYDRTKAYQVTGGDVGKVNKIITADIDADGFEEIIVAHGNGWISVLSHDGYMKPGWPKQIKYSDGTAVLRDVRSLHVTSLKNDGKYQIIAGAATNRAENVWVFDSTGNLLPGWPQLSKDQNAYYLSDFKNPGGAFSYGVFMDGVMAGDITGDGIKEILVAIDDAYICAYDINGKLVPANAQVFGGRTWGKVGLFEDYSYENSLSADRKADHNWNQGQGLSSAQGRSQLYRGELGHASVRVVDIDNNGSNEVVVTGIIADKKNDEKTKVYGGNELVTSRYMSVFIFNADRTRYKGWEKSPSDLDFMGAPLFSYPETLSLNVESVPVIADLDGDGVNEIIFNAYDGKVHAFSINNPKKEFGNFPYAIPQHDGTVELPNEVVCADITGDGKKELIFTTNTMHPSGSGEPAKKGGLYVLNHDGTLLTNHDLPDGYKVYETKLPAFTNGSLAAPAVKDIDGDGKFEVIINTKYSGICAFRINVAK